MYEHLSEKKLFLLACFILLLGTIFYFYEFLLQVSPNVMVPNLMHDFRVDATAIGNLTAFYFVAYACLQIPAGALFICCSGFMHSSFVVGGTCQFQLHPPGQKLTEA